VLHGFCFELADGESGSAENRRVGDDAEALVTAVDVVAGAGRA
jgi:hypothetical protein